MAWYAHWMLTIAVIAWSMVFCCGACDEYGDYLRTTHLL